MIKGSVSEILGKGFCGKKQVLKAKEQRYLVKDFTDDSITECDSSQEVTELIGITMSNVSTYCRLNSVYKGRWRITRQDDPDWTTNMDKVLVKIN